MFPRSRLSTGLGASLQFIYYHPELGPEFIRKLFGDMQPTFGRDRRQITDWLAQGRYRAMRRLPRYSAGKEQGLPVDELDNVEWKEGVQLTSGGGSMSLIKGAPNPNAAKSVSSIGFFPAAARSPCKNITDLYGEDAPNSRRVDIPKDMLAPVNRMIPGKRYFDVSDPKYADMTPMFNLIKEIMKAREERKD